MNKIQAYQSAAKTRGTGLSDLIANKIIGGGGIGGSIKKSIGEKMAARSMGLKEKFDPLNMASALMGRSKLGTAIVGKMMGRGGEESQYFANKGKKKSFSSTMKSIGGLMAPVQQESSITIFEKIYDLIKSQNEERVKLREKENDFKEEQDMEDERRHKELLDAILKSKGMGKTATPVEKKEGGGIFDMIKNMLSSMMKTVKGMIESAIKGVKDLFSDALTVAKAIKEVFGLGELLSTLRTISAFFGGTIAGPLLAIIAAGVAGIWQYNKVKEDILKNPNDPKYKDNPFAMKVRGEAESETHAGAMNKAAGMRRATRGEIVDAVKSLNDTELEQQYGANSVELSQWLRDNPKPSATWQAPVKATRLQRESTRPKSESIDYEGGTGEKSLYDAARSREQANNITTSMGAVDATGAATGSVPNFEGTKSASGKDVIGSMGAVDAMGSATGSSPIAPTATPIPAKEGTPPALAVTNENKALELQRIATEHAEPIIMNKVNSIPLPSGNQNSGTVTGAASVRNDHLDDFLLGNMKRVAFM
jgi:uncharacterized protein YjgD (DUF1641 family)